MYKCCFANSEAQNIAQELIWDNVPFNVIYHPFDPDGVMISSESERFKEIVESKQEKHIVDTIIKPRTNYATIIIAIVSLAIIVLALQWRILNIISNT